ncbi:MAG: phage tail protein [Lachnospiraceae bacterium]
MLKIYDQNHNQLGMLTRYADLKEEKDLDTADKNLSFTVKDPDEIELKNEYYVRTRTDEYVIKKISHKSRSGMTVTCILNLEELQGQPFASFTVTDRHIRDAAETALNGTGWTVGYCDVDKVRSAGMVDCNALQVINNLCAAWMCEHEFDTLHKQVHFYNRKGARKGAYFIDGLNLKEITRETDSCDYYTIIIPYGAEGLTIESVNDGKNYLENYQYSTKKLAYIWKDESYTDAQALKEDAELKLAELSKPKESYSCSVVDLARQRKDYGILSYDLGDEVRLIDRETKTLTWQRIVKMITYPEKSEKNTCELSSTVLTFTQMQEKLKRASEIINFVISGDGQYTGKINVSDILNFEAGLAKTETIKTFNRNLDDLRQEVEDMQEDLGGIGNLSDTYAELGKANIPDGWTDTDMIADGAVTAAKLDLQDATNAMFAQVIQGAQFTDAYLQAPTMTGAKIDADSLTVQGKDILQMIEDLSGLAADAERIKKLEESVKEIIEALSNVIATE